MATTTYTPAPTPAPDQSEDEVLAHLASVQPPTAKFNVDAALKAGYTKQQLIQHLSTPYVPASQSSLPPPPAGISPQQTVAQQTVVQGQPQSAPGPGAGSPSGSGFGTIQPQLAPPPEYHQGLFTPNESNRRLREDFDTNLRSKQAIALAEAQRTADTKKEHEKLLFEQQQRDAIADKFKAAGVVMTPREEMIIRTGHQFAPERAPMTLTGVESTDDILKGNPGAVDGMSQQPLPPGRFVRTRIASNGSKEFFLTAGGETQRSYIDAADGKSYLATYDRDKKEIGRKETINPLTLPQVTTDSTSGTTMSPMQVENPVSHRMETVQVPTPHTGTTSKTVQRVLPGASPAAPAAPAAPAGRPAPSGGRPSLPAPPGASVAPPAASARPDLPPGSRVIGATNSQQKEDVDNPLTAGAQAIVLKTQPQIANLTKLKALLVPYKDSTTPLTTFLPRIAYQMGFSSDDPKKNVNQLLSSLEMTDITSAAAILQGSSRSRQVLDRALLHTPNAWKDAGKLQYDKVTSMLDRLQDIVKVAKGPEGQKHPGLTPPPASSSFSYTLPSGKVMTFPDQQSLSNFKTEAGLQ